MSISQTCWKGQESCTESLRCFLQSKHCCRLQERLPSNRSCKRHGFVDAVVHCGIWRYSRQ